MKSIGQLLSVKSTMAPDRSRVHLFVRWEHGQGPIAAYPETSMAGYNFALLVDGALRVSPAVFELLESDPLEVVRLLKVVDVEAVEAFVVDPQGRLAGVRPRPRATPASAAARPATSP